MLAAFKLRAVPINVNYRYVEDELRYLLDDADARRGRVPPRVRAQARRDPRRSCPQLQHVRRGRRRHPAPRRRRSTARRVRGRARGRVAGARLRAALGRRPLHPLHRRHHRHAQGRDVAPRGHLLRRDRRRGRRRRRRSRTPEEIAERCLEPRTRCVPACPFMHGTAHWMAFSALFTGGTVVIPAEHHLDPLALWQLVEREQANFLVIVGDAFARPLLDALDTAAGRALDVSRAARAAVGRRDPLAHAEARARRTAARRARRRRLRRVGDRRPGPVGRRRGRRRSRPRRASASTTRRRCSTTTCGPARAGRRRPARPPRATSRSATTRTRRRPRRRSRWSTACAGRCPATTRSSTTTARSRCSGAARCRSTPAARRCTPKRSSRC